jgi:nucleoside-diphosphate-sugar epimerase
MQTLLKVARETKLAGWFLYASSAAVYGGAAGGAVKEADAQGANLQSPYAASKVQNEIQGKLYRDMYGLHTLGMRFFNVYGPGQRADSPYSALMAKLMDSVLNGSLLTIYGDGKQTRDFIAVKDVALVVKLLLQTPLRTDIPAVVNVGSGASVSLLDAIRTVVALKRVNPRVEYRPQRKGDIMHSCSDVTALRALLPMWEPKTLQNGMREWLVELER